MPFALFLNLFLIIVPFNYPAWDHLYPNLYLISENVENNDFTSLISLSSFSGYGEENIITLSWLSSEEIAAVVERSYDNKKWMTLNTPLQTSHDQYIFLLDHPKIDSSKVYYRLRAMENEVFIYSSIIEIKLSSLELSGLIVIDEF